jgi:hypothetical protein
MSQAGSRRSSKVGVQLAARRGTQHSTGLTAREGEAAAAQMRVIRFD